MVFGRVAFLVQEGVGSTVGIIGSRGLFALEIDEGLVLVVSTSVLGCDSWSSVPCFPSTRSRDKGTRIFLPYFLFILLLVACINLVI